MVVFLGFGLAATAQSQKQKDKAMEQVKELNTQLTDIDKTLALSEEQMEKIMMLEIKKTKDMRAIKKNDGTNEDKKEKRKEYRNALKEVLTKKQNKALRAAKKKNKE